MGKNTVAALWIMLVSADDCGELPVMCHQHDSGWSNPESLCDCGGSACEKPSGFHETWCIYGKPVFLERMKGGNVTTNNDVLWCIPRFTYRRGDQLALVRCAANQVCRPGGRVDGSTPVCVDKAKMLQDGASATSQVNLCGAWIVRECSVGSICASENSFCAASSCTGDNEGAYCKSENGFGRCDGDQCPQVYLANSTKTDTYFSGALYVHGFGMCCMAGWDLIKESCVKLGYIGGVVTERTVRDEDFGRFPSGSPLNNFTVMEQHPSRQWSARRKDFNVRTNYRLLRAAGLTHDFPEEEPPELTPLEQLQRDAQLPRNTTHDRFNFPHTLDYKVYWGPPSVQEEPNKWEGSMVGAQATFRVSDLGLTTPQKERMVTIVQDRYHRETDVVCIESDSFPDRNHNCALLGDMLQALVEETKKS